MRVLRSTATGYDVVVDGAVIGRIERCPMSWDRPGEEWWLASRADGTALRYRQKSPQEAAAALTADAGLMSDGEIGQRQIAYERAHGWSTD